MAGCQRARGPGQFASPFCAWCPGRRGCETCCMSYWCPCVQFGYNAEKLIHEDVACGASCLPAGVMYAALMFGPALLTAGVVPCGFQWILHMRAREVIRRKYALKEEPCNDCCTVFCCPTCAHCQETYQLTGPHNAGHLVTVPPTSAPPQYQQVPAGPTPEAPMMGTVAYGVPVGAPPLPAYPPHSTAPAYPPYPAPYPQPAPAGPCSPPGAHKA